MSQSALVPLQLLAFLAPLGLILLAVGASREDEARTVLAAALTAAAIAVVGYFLLGFGLQFGGVGLVSNAPGLEGLTAEWSPLDRAWGPGWGVIGLRGFMLLGTAYSADAYSLLLSQLPAVIAVAVIVVLALRPYLNYGQLLVVGLLVSALVYPLAGNWTWGGGWLYRLGENAKLGHGVVDGGGAGTIFLVGAAIATAGLLLTHRPARPEASAKLPPAHLPLFLLLGVTLSLCGWSGLVLGNPLIAEQVVAPLVIVNLLLGAIAGALITSVYSWFVSGQPEALATTRGALAGLVAISAACAVVPAWSALVIGAVGGLLMVLTLYVWDYLLQFHDPIAVGPLCGIPAMWGLLAVGIFADGHWGAGWNGVGSDEYLGIMGQGVSGLLVGPKFQTAGGRQLQAQCVGLAALLLLAFAAPWLLFRTGQWLREAMHNRHVIVREAEETPQEAVSTPDGTPVEAESPTEGENLYRIA